MKFKIRAPFSVHVETVLETKDAAGRKVKSGKTESHFWDETIDISEAEARKHLHKLEPIDDDAKALMAVEHDKVAQIASARAGTAAAADPVFVAAVAAALRESGAIPTPAKR